MTREDSPWSFSGDDWLEFLRKETAQPTGSETSTADEEIDEAIERYLATESPKAGNVVMVQTLTDRINRIIPFIGMDRPIPFELEYKNEMPLYQRLYTQQVPEIHPGTDDVPADFAFSPRFAEYRDIHIPDCDPFAKRLGAQRIQKIIVGIQNDPVTRTEASQYLKEHSVEGFDYQTEYLLVDGRLIKVGLNPMESEDDRVDVVPEDPKAKHVLCPFTKADPRIVERVLGHFLNQVDPH